MLDIDNLLVQVGGYQSFVVAKYVRRSTGGNESISRKQLATKVAEVVKAFVEVCYFFALGSTEGPVSNDSS